MEITFDMEYTQKVMSTMQKAVRVALQEERDKKSKLVAAFFIVCAIIILATADSFDYRQIIAIVVLIVFVLYLVFQDQVAGWLSGGKIPKSMKKVRWTFREDGFFSTSEAGISGFDYDTIFAMIEIQNCMVLCFANSQAQVIDMTNIQGGTVADFRRILRKHTSLTIQQA